MTSVYLLARRKWEEIILFRVFYYWGLPNCLLLFVYLDCAPPNHRRTLFSYLAVGLSVGSDPLLSWFNQLIVAEPVQSDQPNDAVWTHTIFSQL